MRISSLSITDFRNYTSLQTEFAPGVNIFYGQNGAGKTNLLEAIFNLCLGRSQRGAQDMLMVRNGCDVYRLEGDVQDGRDEQRLAVAYQKRLRKKITIDEVVVKISELYERFCAVSSGPEDSSILSGPPSARRGFMDIYLSQLSRRYLADLTDYQKVVAQKNAALKQQMDPSAFEPLLITIGSKIMRRRIEFIDNLRKLAVSHYDAISDGEKMELRYDPSVSLESDTSDQSDIEEAFLAKLERNAERERIMQSSMVGPHRDEIAFEINGYPARTHGSQGQWRTGAISLKLAIYDLIKEKRGTAPVLLLDEIFAELDQSRAESLIDAFKDFSQLFLTTAIDPPEKLRTGSRSHRINEGQIEEIS